jgi:hypothetical protein
VYLVGTGHSAADGHPATANEDTHEGTDSVGHAHPADRHTYSHRDGDPDPADRDADAADGDAPAGDRHGMRCRL